jgi:2'-5' RNA ligase
VARVDDAIGAARTVRAPAHRLPITCAEYWPHNRIVWTGPERAPAPTRRLAHGLNKVLTQAGFSLERRRFAAHVTLVRKARAPQLLPPLPKVDWPVDAFVLVRSRLSKEGSYYDLLERFPLRGRS